MEGEIFPIFINNDQLAIRKPAVKTPIASKPKSTESVQIDNAEPEKPKKVTRLKKGIGLRGINTGMLSVKAMLEDSGANNSEDEEIEDFSDRPRTPFDEEQFTVQWKAYIEILKNNKRASLASTLASCHPELQENFVLNMVFDNIVQESEFNNEKTEILGFIREKLNNWGIQIKTEVKVEEKKKRYYTNRERLERMIELNPKLEEMRRRLNLDPDF